MHRFTNLQRHGGGARSAACRFGVRQLADRRLTRASALVGALVCAAAIGVGPGAGAASAAVSLSNGASASTSIVCSVSMQWMRRTVTMNPESRFSSQSTSTRMYIQPTSGAAGFWTSWTAGNAPSTTVYVTPVGGQSFRVYMQYAWWNGSSWTCAGEWITSYTQVQGTSDYRYQTSYCAT